VEDKVLKWYGHVQRADEDR